MERAESPPAGGASAARGRRIFGGAGCASCHSGPWFTSGEVVPLAETGTNGARLTGQGTRGYRVPTLRRLDLQEIFLHDGSVGSLEMLFDPSRLPVAPGHEHGLSLTESERSDLVSFLLTL